MDRAPVVSVLFAVACVAVLSGVPHGQDRLPAPAAAEVQALVDAGSYEKAEALSRTRVELLTARHGGDSLEVAAASDLLVRTLLLNGHGAAASTLNLAARTVRQKEALLGTTHVDLIPSLRNLADAQVEAAEYTRAVQAAQRAVALHESGARPGVDRAEALDHLGSAMTAAGRYADALAVLRRSLQIKESTVEPKDVRIARTLEAIGWALQRNGDYDGARGPVRRAVAIQEAANAAHPAYAESLNLLGLQLWFEGNLPEARDVSMRAVATAERTLRPDHPTVARALNYLAGTELDLGDLVLGHSLLERALAIAERTFGPSHHQTWAYLNDVALSEMYLAAYPTARVLFERSLTIGEASFGAWDDRVATTANNLALVDAELGDYRAARREHLRAINIWERVFSRDHPFVARALMDLAAVYREQGAPVDALPLLERALAIRERSLGREHQDVATTLADLAATLAQLGRIDRAQTMAARAVRIWESAGAPEAPEFATALRVYADLQMVRHDPAAARRYYERALAVEEKIYGRAHPVVAATEAGLALALAGLGEPASAFRSATDAETIGRDHLRMMLRYLPERQALNYAASRPKGLDLALSLVAVAPDAATAALDGLIRSRALVLDEMAARRQTAISSGEDAAPLRARLAAAEQRLANLVVRGPGDQPPARYVMLVEAARSESELAERALAERSAPFRAELSRSHLGLDEVRAALPPDAALVSFVRYRRQRPPSTAPQPAYLAFVLRPGQPPVAVPLGSTAVIDTLVAQWRKDIVAEAIGPATVAGGARPSARASGAALRRRVWDPIATHLQGSSRVFIVPDGTLSLVPFVALPVGRTAHLLEEAPVVHYLSTERDLVPQPGASTTAGEGLFAMGGPAFDDRTLFGPPRQRDGTPSGPARTPSAPVGLTRSACGSLQSFRFPQLDGTLQEVRDVADLWKSPVSGGAGDAKVLVARDASERAFKLGAPRHRVLHLATHGFFLGSACSTPADSVRSAGGLVPSGTRGVGGLVKSGGAGPVENPLLLSGLALAGANRRASAGPGDEDGILTAEEVASLSLDGVEWAVLSACDTGVGEVKAGEGVFGLRRAFQVAGVNTVIMSLWSVDDQATRQWMRALYEARLVRRLDTADSVRAAALSVLRARRAKGQSTLPFYWAAFVAGGDWR